MIITIIFIVIFIASLAATIIGEKKDILDDDHLCFSISTIKAHISSIIQKTGFPSLARVAIYAVNNGLIVAD